MAATWRSSLTARWSIRRSQAAENLAKDGIETTVVNARFVKPLDAGLLLALARTKRLIVTVEEAYLAGGFGSAVMELLEENGLHDQVRVVRMGVPDRIVTHGDAKLLLAKYGLDADGIYTRVKESVEVLEDRRAKRQKVQNLKYRVQKSSEISIFRVKRYRQPSSQVSAPVIS